MENFDDEQPEAKAHENGAAEANGSARSGGSGNRFSSAAKRDMSGFGHEVSSEVSSSAIGWLTSKKRALSITYAVCCVLLVFVVGLASGVPFWLVLLRSILFAAVSFAAAMVVFMVLEKKLLDPPLEGAAAGAPAGLGVREDVFASMAEDDAAAETAPAAQPQNRSTTQAIGAKNSAGFTRGSAVNIAVGDETPAEHEAPKEHKAAAPETENSSAAHSFEALNAKPTDAAPVNASKVGYNMRNIFNSAKERNVSQVNTSEELKKSRHALSSDPQKFGLALRRWLQDT